MTSRISKVPWEDVPIVEEDSSQNSSDIIGYRLVLPQDTNDHDYTKMNPRGWCLAMILGLLCPCCAFIPSMLPYSYDEYQIPIYKKDLKKDLKEMQRIV